MHAAVLEIELCLYEFHLFVLKMNKVSDSAKLLASKTEATRLTAIIQLKIQAIFQGKDATDIYLTKMNACLNSIITHTKDKTNYVDFSDPINVSRLLALHDEFINLCLSYRSKLSAERMEQISTHLEQIVKNITLTHGP